MPQSAAKFHSRNAEERESAVLYLREQFEKSRRRRGAEKALRSGRSAKHGQAAPILEVYAHDGVVTRRAPAFPLVGRRAPRFAQNRGARLRAAVAGAQHNSRNQHQ
jgi:hypothetical protein